MDALNWVNQLSTYGPYAVLALFAIWLAPAQTKAFLNNPGNSRTKQAVGALAVVGCWLSVFAMVGYIYQFWPARTVYLGSFGVHSKVSKFYSESQDLYIVSWKVGDKLRWDYAVVADSRPTGAADTVVFAYEWEGDTNKSAEFFLPLSLLRKHRIDFYSDPEHPDVLFYDDDSDPATPRKKPFPSAGAQVVAMPVALGAVVATAQAQQGLSADTTALPEWLASSDGNLRAQARAQLRRMSPDELLQLLQTPSLSNDAAEQINAELSRRR